jgi:hypothetical protein
MRHRFTREDCLDYVFWKLQNGDCEILALFELVAMKQEWISLETYKETAEVLYNRLKNQEDGKDCIL